MNYFTKKILIFIAILFSFAFVSLQAQAPVVDGFVDTIYYSNGYVIDYVGFYASAKASLYVLDDVSIDPN